MKQRIWYNCDEVSCSCFSGNRQKPEDIICGRARQDLICGSAHSTPLLTATPHRSGSEATKAFVFDGQCDGKIFHLNSTAMTNHLPETH